MWRHLFCKGSIYWPKNRKRNRLSFFNSDNGRTLRLCEARHEYKQKRPALFCALCGTIQEGQQYRGHRSTFSCELCCVRLCIRVWPGFRKRCWSLWHSARVIQPRSVQSSRTATVPLSEEQAAPHENNNGVVGEESVVNEGHTPLQKRRRRT